MKINGKEVNPEKVMLVNYSDVKQITNDGVVLKRKYGKLKREVFIFPKPESDK